MKASEIVEFMEQLIEKYGDLPIFPAVGVLRIR